MYKCKCWLQFSPKTPTLALFVCGGGDLTVVKDCPCVLPKNYQVQCSCQKGFPLPNVFRHKCPGLNHRYSLRWEMLQCYGDSGWFTLTLIFVGPGHYPPSLRSCLDQKPILRLPVNSSLFKSCSCPETKLCLNQRRPGLPPSPAAALYHQRCNRRADTSGFPMSCLMPCLHMNVTWSELVENF